MRSMRLAASSERVARSGTRFSSAPSTVTTAVPSCSPSFTGPLTSAGTPSARTPTLSSRRTVSVTPRAASTGTDTSRSRIATSSSRSPSSSTVFSE